MPKADEWKGNIWFYGSIIIYLVIILFPLYWMAVTALKTRPEIYSFPPTFVPRTVTLEWFHNLLTKNRVMLRYFMNSVVIGSSTVAICLTTGFLAAYSLSRYPLRFNRGILLSIISTQMFPYALILIPLYVYFVQLNVLDTYGSIIVVHTAYALPFCILILKGFCDTFPTELEDAARIDGCGTMNLLVKIILPIIKPGMAAAGVYTFILSWSEFIFAYTLTTSDAVRPVTTGLITRYAGYWTFSWGDLMANVLVIILPLVVIYILLQRHVVAGLSAGALK